MWRFLIACLAILLPVSGAMAAERVLLYPQGQGPMARSAAGPASMQALRQDAAEDGRVSVIIGLKVPFAPEGALPASEVKEQREEIADATATVSARFASSINRAPAAVRTYETIPFMAMEVTPAELERLAADPNVISIIENERLKPSLAQSLPLIQGNQAHAAGFTGSSQTIAILDTGVDKNHPFFGGRVVSEACFSTTNSQSTSVCPGGVQSSTAPGSGMHCSVEGCDHGTHVAGIAAGSNSSIRGVAPQANIIAIQVFSRFGNEVETWFADVLRGLERVFALRNQYSIAAANLSLGGGRYTSTCDSTSMAFAAVVANLKAAGIATIAASGNEGYTDAVSFPACLSNVVSVGSVSTRNWGLCEGATTAQDKVACYSNSASFLSLLAPGSPITSSIPNGGYAGNHGTSMAAPHVAGAWALIKQKSPDASVDAVLAALRNTGRAVVDDRNGISKPRINVQAALNTFTTVQRVLTYVKAGTGSGTVSFSPAGGQASCNANCTNSYVNGQTVTLTATALSGSTFAGWSGGVCTGTAPSCTVTMTAARSVTATFNPPPTPVLSYTKGGGGNGTVFFSPAGTQTDCAASCNAQFASGTAVRLTAVAAPNSVFKGWQGACVGMGRCRVSMTEPRAVTAVFDLIPSFTLTLDATGSGTGTVSFAQPAGVAPCTGDCTRSFSEGLRVTLVAQAAANARFAGWGGACSGTKPCTVNMTQARTVTAAFNTVPSFTLTYDATGSGTVSFAEPAGVASCTADCTRNFAEGTRVTLVAQAAANFRFAGWGGACTGLRACTVSMTQARTVAATFTAVPTFTLSYTATGNGTGTVSFAQAAVEPCTTNCTRTFEEGTRVTLVAQAGANSRFAGWGGACSGNRRASCRVSMKAAQTVTAAFTRP